VAALSANFALLQMQMEEMLVAHLPKGDITALRDMMTFFGGHKFLNALVLDLTNEAFRASAYASLTVMVRPAMQGTRLNEQLVEACAIETCGNLRMVQIKPADVSAGEVWGGQRIEAINGYKGDTLQGIRANNVVGLGPESRIDLAPFVGTTFCRMHHCERYIYLCAHPNVLHFLIGDGRDYYPLHQLIKHRVGRNVRRFFINTIRYERAPGSARLSIANDIWHGFLEPGCKRPVNEDLPPGLVEVITRRLEQTRAAASAAIAPLPSSKSTSSSSPLLTRPPLHTAPSPLPSSSSSSSSSPTPAASPAPALESAPLSSTRAQNKSVLGLLGNSFSRKSGVTLNQVSQNQMRGAAHQRLEQYNREKRAVSLPVKGFFGGDAPESVVVVLSGGGIAPPSDLFAIVQDACLRKLEIFYASFFRDSDCCREYMALYRPPADVLQHFYEARGQATSSPLMRLPMLLFARCVAFLGDDMTRLRSVHKQWRDRCTPEWVGRVLDSADTDSSRGSRTPPARRDSDDDGGGIGEGSSHGRHGDEDPDMAFERFDRSGSRSGSEFGSARDSGDERESGDGRADDDFFSAPLAFLE
jgi:hypothetical protein